ncbi:hypothetical protein OG689_33810 [Kitasatospora sp. NBC_00240]|uniref:hypothetical protein n=1 Tax=Kitasatospora sp. NBC_00240 TaxID=2903567 RepID=UPI002256499C|nr:hypothetical protein [Kitasatospora sp. NBC_00240]MCX5214181.1 hypothetical protein [Kitasatospora sp. NBC_00240]
MARDAAPRLAAALDAVPAGRQRADQAFGTGLRAMLAGYRVMLPPAAPGAAV